MKQLRTIALASLCLLLGSGLPLHAREADTKASALVIAMGEKLKNAKTVKAKGTRHLDPALIRGSAARESVNFDLTLVRPGKIYVRTTNEVGPRRLIANGKKLILTDDTENLYATANAKGKSVDDLIEAIQDKLGFRPVLAEFLGSDPADDLLEGVTSQRVRGVEQVNGVKCTRLAFTQPDAKWDLWLAESDGLPRKIVVTYTSIKGSPKSMAIIHGWELDTKVPRKTFAFKPGKDAVEIPIIPTR